MLVKGTTEQNRRHSVDDDQKNKKNPNKIAMPNLTKTKSGTYFMEFTA